jgi:hypothetical protein
LEDISLPEENLRQVTDAWPGGIIADIR